MVIMAMFHQVRVPIEDADLLRFIWWPDRDLNQDLSELRMMVHLFRATSSPAFANFALSKCSEDNKEQFSQSVIDNVRHCFYVYVWCFCLQRRKLYLFIMILFLSVQRVVSSLGNG